MITKYSCNCCHSKSPISVLEFENTSRVSYFSAMTETTSETNDDSGSVGVTITDESSQSGSITLSESGKPIWDGKTVYTVEQGYLGDIVERTNKDTIRKLAKMISKVIFPNQKFIPNWSSCITLSHNTEKDIEENDAAWLHHLFKKMNWEVNAYFPLYRQAIMWNTYKHAFKHQFNNYRATHIAKMKKHVLGGK